jgi:hypothetical protein
LEKERAGPEKGRDWRRKGASEEQWLEKVAAGEVYQLEKRCGWNLEGTLKNEISGLRFNTRPMDATQTRCQQNESVRGTN